MLDINKLKRLRGAADVGHVCTLGCVASDCVSSEDCRRYLAALANAAEELIEMARRGQEASQRREIIKKKGVFCPNCLRTWHGYEGEECPVCKSCDHD